MLYESHEILGTELPIYREQEDEHFTHEEIIHLNEKTDDYVQVGYVQVKKGQKVLFQPVFQKKG
jgi:hypothetical protein